MTLLPDDIVRIRRKHLDTLVSMAQEMEDIDEEEAEAIEAGKLIALREFEGVE